MSIRVERGVSSEKLQPGRISRWHVRYSPAFALQNRTNKELEILRKDWERRFGTKAKIVVSDMGEVVVIFSPDSRHKK